jgi:hypothetical protein
MANTKSELCPECRKPGRMSVSDWQRCNLPVTAPSNNLSTDHLRWMQCIYSRASIVLGWSVGVGAGLSVLLYDPTVTQSSKLVSQTHPNDTIQTKFTRAVSANPTYPEVPIANIVSPQVDRCMRDPLIFLLACAVYTIATLHIIQTLSRRQKHLRKFVVVGAVVGLGASLPKNRCLAGRTAISYLPLAMSMAILISAIYHETIFVRGAGKEKSNAIAKLPEKTLQQA